MAFDENRPRTAQQPQPLGNYGYNHSPSALTNLLAGRIGEGERRPDFMPVPRIEDGMTDGGSFNSNSPPVGIPDAAPDPMAAISEFFTQEAELNTRADRPVRGREAPERPNTPYDRRRAESMINQMIEQGMSPEAAVSNAAVHMVTAAGDTSIYNSATGIFGNLQHRFNGVQNLRDFVDRIGGDINDLSELQSYGLNEAAVAEMAGYEYTSGQPGPASQELEQIRLSYGDRLNQRDQDRVARLSDIMMSDFFGAASEEATQSAEPRPRDDATPTSQQDGAMGAAPESSMRPIMRPGDMPGFRTPITVLDDQGNAMSWNSMTTSEQRRYLMNNPQAAYAVTEQAAPPVGDDVDLATQRATGEERQPTDIILPAGGDTPEGRRAQGFLDRMFNRGSSLDAEEARMRRQNFFRVFAESLNYLTTGSANLGPVYASNDRREAEFRELRDEQQQQAVLAEMATNMGMGELVGLMQLGPQGTAAVRNAVISSVVSGYQAGQAGGSGGGGGGSSGSSSEEEAPDTAAAIGAVQFFETATGGTGEVTQAVASAAGVSQQPTTAAPTQSAAPISDIAAGPTSAADFTGGYQSADNMVDFALAAPQVQAPEPRDQGVELASASTKEPRRPAQPEVRYSQAPVAAPVPTGGNMGQPALGFDPEVVGRQFDVTTLPGQRADNSVPRDTYEYAIDTLRGTPQEAEARRTISQIAQERMSSNPDDVGLRQLEQDLNQLLTDGQEWRLGEQAAELDAANQEAVENEARANRQATIDSALQTVFYDDDRERLAAMGEGAVSDPELMDEFMSAYQDVERAPGDVQLRNTFGAINERHAEYMQNQGRYRSAFEAARDQAIALADPEADPNALQANVISPIRDYLAPVLGEEFFAPFQSDNTRMVVRAVGGLADNALSYVAADVQGNLSNLEGQKLTALFASSTDNRLRGLGMTQYVRANIRRIEALQEASFNYISSLESQSDFDYEEYNQLLNDTAASVQAFEELSPEEFNARVADAQRRANNGVFVPREELGTVYAVRIPAGEDGQFRIEYQTLYDYEGD
jgi:hypothetical protein